MILLNFDIKSLLINYLGSECIFVYRGGKSIAEEEYMQL